MLLTSPAPAGEVDTQWRVRALRATLLAAAMKGHIFSAA